MESIAKAANMIGFAVNGLVVPAAVNFVTGTTKEEKVLQYVLKNAPAGDADAVLAAMDKFGWEEQFCMNLGDEKGAIVDNVVNDFLAQKAPGKERLVFVELGCYCGYSAIRISNLLKKWFESNHVEDAIRPIYYSLEVNETFAKIAQEIINHAGLADYVSIIVGPAGETITQMKSKYGVEFADLVFIDHWKDLYLPDFRILEDSALLRQGSVVCADNVITPGE
eukprot:Colp12_sorted_trinity150504_noHs@23674